MQLGEDLRRLTSTRWSGGRSLFLGACFAWTFLHGCCTHWQARAPLTEATWAAASHLGWGLYWRPDLVTVWIPWNVLQAWPLTPGPGALQTPFSWAGNADRSGSFTNHASALDQAAPLGGASGHRKRKALDSLTGLTHVPFSDWWARGWRTTTFAGAGCCCQSTRGRSSPVS